MITAFLFMATAPVATQADISPNQARAIAKEAYVYGLPLVMNYKAIYLSAFCKECPGVQSSLQSNQEHGAGLDTRG